MPVYRVILPKALWVEAEDVGGAYQACQEALEDGIICQSDMELVTRSQTPYEAEQVADTLADGMVATQWT